MASIVGIVTLVVASVVVCNLHNFGFGFWFSEFGSGCYFDGNCKLQPVVYILYNWKFGNLILWQIFCSFIVWKLIKNLFVSGAQNMRNIKIAYC